MQAAHFFARLVVVGSELNTVRQRLCEPVVRTAESLRCIMPAYAKHTPTLKKYFRKNLEGGRGVPAWDPRLHRRMRRKGAVNLPPTFRQLREKNWGKFSAQDGRLIAKNAFPFFSVGELWQWASMTASKLSAWAANKGCAEVMHVRTRGILPRQQPRQISLHLSAFSVHFGALPNCLLGLVE